MKFRKIDSYGFIGSYIKNFKVSCKTSGKGLWSNVKKNIVHSRTEIVFHKDDLEDFNNKRLKYAELRVYFPKKYWNTFNYGLIYTDPNWIKDFKKELRELGFSKKASKDICYSEQGMQRDNYVSLDAGKEFLTDKRLFKKFNI